MLNLTLQYDICRLRAGRGADFWSAAADNDLDRGAALRMALATGQPGDVFCVAPGRFDVGGAERLLLPPGVTLRGASLSYTVLESQVVSDRAGTAFSLSNGNLLEDLSLIEACRDPNEDGRCVGFDTNTATGAPRIARLNRCGVFSDDWAVYNWSATQDSIMLMDCPIKFGRVGLANMNSGLGNTMLAYRCSFEGDGALSNSAGASSSPVFGGVYGACAMGGLTRLIDCEMTLKARKPAPGPSQAPWTVGVTDTFEHGPAGSALVEVDRLRITIDPNGADPAKCWDVRLTSPKTSAQTTVNVLWGSGPNRAAKISKAGPG